MEGGRTAARTAFLSVVEEGARRYLEHLRALVSHASGSPRDVALRTVARALAQTLERVLQTGKLAPADVQIPTAPLIRAGGHPELLNTWAVGLGNPTAPLVVVGPRPVYELDRFEFLLEGMLLQALWLTNADVHVAAGLLERATWSELPFQRYPNDLYEEPSRSTWGRLAALLALAWGGDARELLRPKRMASNPAPHLFDDAYLLDLSTVPAQWADHTAATPMGERETFLSKLLAAMPEPRLLLMQARPDDTEWSEVRLRLAARFLDFPPEDLKACLQTERPTRTWDELRWFLHGGRGVLFCVPLRHEVSDGYWERAAELIQMLLPERPGPTATLQA